MFYISSLTLQKADMATIVGVGVAIALVNQSFRQLDRPSA